MKQTNQRTTEQHKITLVSPEGKIVRTSEYFECPAVIIIGHNGVAFDGWVVRTDVDIPESDLPWLAHQLDIVQDTQGAERAEALVAALQKLLSNQRWVSDAPCESWPERRTEFPDTEQVTAPFCISPDGSAVNAVEELPDLPLPKKVIVGQEFMLVDGWHFQICPITKPHLEWLVRQACRWHQEDPSPENASQINGMVEAIEARIKNGDASCTVLHPREAI